MRHAHALMFFDALDAEQLTFDVVSACFRVKRAHIVPCRLQHHDTMLNYHHLPSKHNTSLHSQSNQWRTEHERSAYGRSNLNHRAWRLESDEVFTLGCCFCCCSKVAMGPYFQKTWNLIRTPSRVLVLTLRTTSCGSSYHHIYTVAWVVSFALLVGFWTK